MALLNIGMFYIPAGEVGNKMKVSNVIDEFRSIDGATIQVVAVEKRVDREGLPILKDNQPKFRVEAILKSPDGSLSVTTFTATHAAGEQLSTAPTMSKWKVETVDGWLYSQNDRVSCALSVSEISAVSRGKADG